MRFDDRIATITAQRSEDPRARAAIWRQLVDILAQPSARDLSAVTRESAYVFLEQERQLLDPAERRLIATGLARQALSPEMVRFFALDRADVAVPILSSAKLTADEWLDLIGGMTPVARSLLRQRKDLAEQVQRRLADYGASDFMLEDGRPVEELPVASFEPPAPVADDEPPASLGRPGQIRELVDRIERFRAQRKTNLPKFEGNTAKSAISEHESATEIGDPLRHFRFEADHDGLIQWVDAVERTSLIGHSLGEAASVMGYGVDGHVAGAFARRSAFRDGRLLVPGNGPAGGHWCISGVPLFDDDTGRFRGYRGTARRPYPHEHPAGEDHENWLPKAVDEAMELQRLRELVHELRTPLNAISGFGDMIRSQFLGPVSQQYRQQAETIVRSAAELTQIIDDLAMIVHNPSQNLVSSAPDAADNDGVDGGEVLRRVIEAHRDQAETRNLHLQVQIGRSVPPLLVGEPVLERIMSRLLGNLMELCHQGESISIDFLSLPKADCSACLSISRPGKLLGIPADQLFDPDRGASESDIDGPRLSLAFTLHLLRNVARQFHGDLDIADHDVLLLLPSAMNEHSLVSP